MLAHGLTISVLLLAMSTFAESQPTLHAEEAIVSNRTLHAGRVALSGEEGLKKENSIVPGSTAALATGSHFSYTMVGGFSERHLVIPITDTGSLQTAIECWCDDSQTAEGTYGDISTWCVKIYSSVDTIPPHSFSFVLLPHIALPPLPIQHYFQLAFF